MVRTCCVYNFDWETCCAPQRRTLFNISTSKSVPTTDCFAHSDFKICSSQQHFFLTFSTSKNVSKIACFGHFGLQKMFRGTEACIFLNKYTGQQSFEAKVLLAFWLGNAFRPTAACTFSTFQLPGSRCFQHVYFQNLFRALKARNFDLIIYWRIRPGRGIKLAICFMFFLVFFLVRDWGCLLFIVFPAVFINFPIVFASFPAFFLHFP